MMICIFKCKSRASDGLGRTLVFVAFTASFLLFCATSSAQQPDTQTPDEVPISASSNTQPAHICPSVIPVSRKNDAAYLSLKGVKCFETGEFSRAYSLYSRALEIAPNPTLYGAIGRVLHELGIYTLAEIYYQEYLDRSPSVGESGTQMIQNRLEQLEQELTTQAGTIHVASAPSNATAFLVLPNQDWLELGQTPLRVSAQTGKYKLIVVQEGFYRQSHTVNLSSNGKTAYIMADLVPETDVFNVTARQWRRAGTWTMIAGSPVTLAGITLLILGQQDISAANHYSLQETGHTEAEKRALLNRGNDLRTWGIVTASIGTATILTGAILYINGNEELAEKTTSTPGQTPQKPAARLAPLFGFDQIGVQLTW